MAQSTSWPQSFSMIHAPAFSLLFCQRLFYVPGPIQLLVFSPLRFLSFVVQRLTIGPLVPHGCEESGPRLRL